MASFEDSSLTTPLRSTASKLFPSFAAEATPNQPGAPANTPVFSSPFTPMSSLPKVEETPTEIDESENKSGFDILDSDRCISQIKVSESAAVEELALKSFQLIDSEDKVQAEIKRAEYAENEIEHLKSVISTMELSIEQHVLTCSELQVENKDLKIEVSDLKNQVTIAHSSQDLLIDNNSALTNEVTDARRKLDENQVIIEALRKDVKSYELLHQSQPSYMYSELVTQTRITLQDENKRLQDDVYILKSQIKAKQGEGNELL